MKEVRHRNLTPTGCQGETGACSGVALGVNYVLSVTKKSSWATSSRKS
ncbi:unnamed protein product [Ectocarpus sp. 6 AP-2014]